MLLTMGGWNAWAAYDAQTALDTVDCVLPDVVIMNVEMQGRRGLRAATRLKQRYQGQCPTLIALSTSAETQLQHDVIQAGIGLHFVKPVQIAALLGTMKEIKENSTLS